MNCALKDLLKPPYEVRVEYGDYRIWIGDHCFTLEAGEKISRTKLKEMAEFTAAAIREKYERDFSKQENNCHEKRSKQIT